MKISPRVSLAFDGRCEAAFRHYERCLDARITFLLPWGKSPMAADAPPDWSTKILHGTIAIGDVEFSGGDMPPDQYDPPRGFEIQLNIDEAASAARAFQMLAENGTVKMPLQQTFFAKRFGIVIDQFGISWSISCGAPDQSS